MPYGVISTNELRLQYDKSLDKMWFKELLRKKKYYQAMLNDQRTAPPGDTYVSATLSGFPMATRFYEGQKPDLYMPSNGNRVIRSYRKAGLETMITDESIKDDVYGNIKQLPSLLVDAVTEKLEYDAAGVLDNGFTTTSAGEDGLALFSASHATLSGTTINNLSTADLGPTSLQAAFDYGDNMVDENGFKRPIKLVGIFIPTANKWVANDLLSATGRVWQYNGSDANGNLLLSRGGVTPTTAGDIAPQNDARNLFAPKNGIVDDWTIFANPYFGDKDEWFAVYEGYQLTCLWKEQPKLENDGNFDIGAKVYKAWARYSMFCNKFRYVYGSAGA
jgi:hypothetical protein